MTLQHFCERLDLTIPFRIVQLTEEEAWEIIEYLDAHAPKTRFIGNGKEGKKGWYVKYRPQR